MTNSKLILFSTPMVQAILEGRKTQTRRTIKLPVVESKNWVGGAYIEHENGERTGVAAQDLPSKFKRGDILLVEWDKTLPVDSDIYLKVTDVRVERLHSISNEDAKAEGVRYSISEAGYCGYDYQSWRYNLMITPRLSFFSLWRKIYDIGKWDELPNPWVFVYTFKRIEKPENF